MANMEKVLPEVLDLVERFLGGEASLSLSAGLTQSGGPAAVAGILNLAAATLEKDLLDQMYGRDRELADQIKDLMFIFEDIMRLDDKAIQRLVTEIDTKDLALSLKAVSDELKDRIFASMSQRAVSALEQEMEFLGPVRLKDVEDAQSRVVKQVRRLEEQGEIVIGGSDDEVLL
jgi:flagellar motor switch protein FliG